MSDEPKKPGRPEKRVSLAPLEFEEALSDLMATGKPADDLTDEQIARAVERAAAETDDDE